MRRWWLILLFNWPLCGVVAEPLQGDSAGAGSSGYVFDITVENATQMEAIFDRAEHLMGQYNPAQHGRIALVLHGRELELFRKDNYANNMSLVERARALDRNQLVDIKACQSVMNSLDIGHSELPEFIEQVPLAPVEIQRLQLQQGFIRL
jgi:hypothetical protein